MPFDWQRLERDEGRRTRGILTVLGAVAAALGVVSIVWGVATRSDRWVDGILQLVCGLVLLGIGLLRTRRSAGDDPPHG